MNEICMTTKCETTNDDDDQYRRDELVYSKLTQWWNCWFSECRH